MTSWPWRLSGLAVAVVLLFYLLIDYGDKHDVDFVYHSRIMSTSQAEIDPAGMLHALTGCLSF